MIYQTPKDLAEALQVSPETVRRKARTGEWPSATIGRLIRFDEDDVARIRELIRTPKNEQAAPGSPQELLARLA